jgi:hypothetical protein
MDTEEGQTHYSLPQLPQQYLHATYLSFSKLVRHLVHVMEGFAQSAKSPAAARAA